MIAEGYGDVRTIERRITAMEAWLDNPELMEADADAEYAEIIEINMSDIHEPILACPNDPDDVKTLSDVAGTHFATNKNGCGSINRRRVLLYIWLSRCTYWNARLFIVHG